MVFTIHLYNASIADPYPFNGGFWIVNLRLIRSCMALKVARLNPKGIITIQ